MRECKVYKVRLIVERKCIAEDSEVRLYLSPVWECAWIKAKRILQKAAGVTIKLLAATAITIPFGIYFVNLAYMERGYRAYGGEWLLIMLIFYAAYKLMETLIRR